MRVWSQVSVAHRADPASLLLLAMVRWWQGGSLGAGFVTRPQLWSLSLGNRAVLQSSVGASAFPSSHSFRVWPGINEMEMPFLLLLSWAQGQTSRGRAELWQRMEKCHSAIPQLQRLHHPAVVHHHQSLLHHHAAHQHQGLVAQWGTKKEIWGFFASTLYVLPLDLPLLCFKTYCSCAVP